MLATMEKKLMSSNANLIRYLFILFILFSWIELQSIYLFIIFWVCVYIVISLYLHTMYSVAVFTIGVEEFESGNYIFKTFWKNRHHTCTFDIWSEQNENECMYFVLFLNALSHQRGLAQTLVLRNQLKFIAFNNSLGGLYSLNVKNICDLIIGINFFVCKYVLSTVDSCYFL